MKIACISDVHASKPEGKNYQVLMSFLNHTEVDKADAIGLLGDVFDHLTGEHSQYLKKYESFYKKLEDHLKAGKTIFIVEGNHDFHFEKISKRRFSHLPSEQRNNFKYIRGSFSYKIGNETYLFCHGDQLDEQNKAYMRWKRIYSSKAFGFFISKILTFKIAESIGEKASENSRERGKSSFEYERVKNHYREMAKNYLSESKYSRMVAGHTHIIDEYEFDGKTYLNIGFPPKDEMFLMISPEGHERISLT